MNKSQLIEKIATGADISKSAAERALNSFIEATSQELQAENKVSIVGFGTFSVKHRAARTGRNPQTGEAIDIAAKNIPSFKPGKTLQDACN